MTTLTIKLSGKLLDDPATLDLLASELTQARDAGARPVVVHGGGPQLTRALTEAGVPEERHHGLRVTPPQAAEIVLSEMDALGMELAAQLTRRGVPAVHIAGRQGRLSAQVKHLDGAPLLGRVGTVKGFDALGLPGPVDGPVPVVTPVGMDAQGPLNVNGDEGAGAIASALAADALLLATDVAGVLDASGQPIDHIDPGQARSLIRSGQAHGGMVPKLNAALDALRSGVGKVLIGPIEPGSLTGVSVGEAEGTIVQGRKVVA